MTEAQLKELESILNTLRGPVLPERITLGMLFQFYDMRGKCPVCPGKGYHHSFGCPIANNALLLSFAKDHRL